MSGDGVKTLGDAIEEQYWGENGVATGTYPNSIGLMNHEARQRREAAARQATAGPPRPPQPYRPLSVIAAVEARIPRRLEQALAVVLALVFAIGAVRSALVPPPFVAGAASWPGVAGMAVAGLFGFAAGFVAIRLALRLLDVGLKLAIGLAVGIALAGAVAALVEAFAR